jgi:hypothetical protein
LRRDVFVVAYAPVDRAPVFSRTMATPWPDPTHTPSTP